MACAIIVLAVAGMTSSCKKKNGDNPEPSTPTGVTMEYPFTANVSLSSLNQTEKAAFSEYLKSKGALPLGESKIYTTTAATENECLVKAKSQAKADFDAVAQNLKVDEVRPLITTGKGFDYMWTFDTVSTSSWNCPALPIGTMVIDGNSKEVARFKKQIGNNSALNLMFFTNNDVDVFRIVMISEAGAIPVGNFNIMDYANTVLRVNDKECEILSGTMNITAESNVYNFTIEGSAKSYDGREFNFSISVKDFRIVG